jgi:ribonuclease VapC
VRSDTSAVLDASALLAYLHNEPGSAVVREALEQGAHISAVNWAEALSKVAERGGNPNRLAQDLENKGILGLALIVHPLDEGLALRIAELRPLTKHAGLSLGDRACLALGSELQLRVLTTDRLWSDLGLGIEIERIR